jgi:hypothetical protein
MDNCSAPVTPEIFKPLSENHIKIVTFAPHTSNIFQALDLSFFSLFKTKEKFWSDQDDDKTFTATIDKLIRQFHSVATPENIRGGFVRAEFSYSTGVIPYVLEFSRERMWRVQVFDMFADLTVSWKVCRCAGRIRSSVSSVRQVSSLSTKRNQNLIEQSREKATLLNSCIFTFHRIESGAWVTFRM